MINHDGRVIYILANLIMCEFITSNHCQAAVMSKMDALEKDMQTEIVAFWPGNLSVSVYAHMVIDVI